MLGWTSNQSVRGRHAAPNTLVLDVNPLIINKFHDVNLFPLTAQYSPTWALVTLNIMGFCFGKDHKMQIGRLWFVLFSCKARAEDKEECLW